MKAKTAKSSGYNYKGWIYLFIPIYINDTTEEVVGRNVIADFVLDFMISIDFISNGFALLITGEL